MERIGRSGADRIAMGWSETGIMESFPREGLRIRWRAPVGPGWSSPVVVQGRVYLTDMPLAQPKAWERIQCFKESNGRLLWSRESELAYLDWAFIPEHGGGPAATPIVEDGKVYWFGRSGQVVCLDARSGKVVRETHLDRKYEIGVLSCRGSLHLCPQRRGTDLRFAGRQTMNWISLTASGRART